MNIEITKTQLNHIIKCLEYCNDIFYSSGDINITNFNYNTNERIIKNLEKVKENVHEN